MSEFILVTDWEKIDEDDFYLTDEWLKDNQGMEQTDIDELRNRVKNGNIFIGYVVKAVDYAIYNQMDALQVLIDGDMNEVLNCESAIINNNHEERIEHNY